MELTQHLLVRSLLSISVVVIAAPMPNSIVVEGKAVVPILKTEVIRRRVTGQEPKRSVDATIFEVTNQGKDIIAREVHLEDNSKTLPAVLTGNGVTTRDIVVLSENE